MSQIQTSCPHCGTSFSVSSEQLKIAQGHVRCGVCMKVFKAGSAPAAEEAPAAKAVTASKGAFDLDNDASIEAWIKKNQKTPGASKNIQSGPVGAPEQDISVESLSFDDELSDAFENLKPAPQPGSKDFSDEEDEDLVEKIETPKTRTLKSPPPAKLKSKAVKQAELEDDFTIEEDAFGGSDFASDFDDDPFAFGDEEPVVHVALGSTDIEEPETFESKLKPRILWPSLATVFSLFLIIQVLIKNFEEWSVDNSYRGFYSVFCSIGLCTLPALKDVESIRGSNLIVRPHPKLSGALIIDAIINNQAPFDQAFPRIYLSFSNVQGKVIASRVFEPKDYLTGELKNLSSMPSKSPLHLSLEILDPGNEAVNYQIDFIDS